jgi:hypothetical protein
MIARTLSQSRWLIAPHRLNDIVEVLTIVAVILAPRFCHAAAGYFTKEKAVGCRNALPNELIRGPFCSVLARFSSHSGSVAKAVIFCSRSAIESQANR